MKYDILHLWYLGDPSLPVYVGTLQHAKPPYYGVSLRYADSWKTNGFKLASNMELSLIECFPPKRQEVSEAQGAGAVDDARPDRWGERVIQRVLNKGATNSLMEYLYFAGDDRFGALGVSTSSQTYKPAPQSPLATLDDVPSMADVVHKIQEREPLSEMEAALLRSGGSLGGAKPKALVKVEDKAWVIKFNAIGSSVDTTLLEYASMTLAQTCGLDVAPTQSIPLTDGHALLVQRFDRAGPYRLHTLSAGTLLRAQGLDPEQAGYPGLATWLRLYGASWQEDNRELFRRMVFNIAMANEDDHEKNHAVLMTPTGFRLSPAYDVLPTLSGQGHQQFTCGSHGVESSLANAMTQYPTFGLSEREALDIVSHVVATVNGWEAHFRACGVSEGDIETVLRDVDAPHRVAERVAYGKGRAPSP